MYFFFLVPSKALTFIDSLHLNTTQKWYSEEGLNQKSIEVKYKLDKLNYSIEFDTVGTIEDIEVEAKTEDLESTVQDLIRTQLDVDCSSHKIRKVQRQYTGTEKDLFSLLNTGKKPENLTIKYELIVKCKQPNSVDLFEYLFDHEGKLMSKSKIVFKNSSHLEY
ncbi:hypothetical protein [Microcoleus sp.]|uniref:hypothetical protein n=1 Tax=Microcoleus sp. TaxID=44472 RepID=UPI003593DB9F